MWENRTISLGLWDTAGQEDYDRLRPLSYPDTNTFLVCFSVINRASYDNVREKWVPEVRHHAPDVPIVLIGTKLDLREDPEFMRRLQSQNSSPITSGEGQKMKEEIRAYRYMECSARTQKGLREVFNTAIEASLKPAAKDEKKKRNCVIV